MEEKESYVKPTEAEIKAFVIESNRIEGIEDLPNSQELALYRECFTRAKLDLEDIISFVKVIAGARLRDSVGMSVSVGGHLPPIGGPEIRRRLLAIVAHANDYTQNSPFEVHVDYERLHPFMDGNGRSGRMIWAWMHLRLGKDPFSLPFLHRFYYETLDHSSSSTQRTER